MILNRCFACNSKEVYKINGDRNINCIKCGSIHTMTLITSNWVDYLGGI